MGHTACWSSWSASSTVFTQQKKKRDDLNEEHRPPSTASRATQPSVGRSSTERPRDDHGARKGRRNGGVQRRAKGYTGSSRPVEYTQTDSKRGPHGMGTSTLHTEPTNEEKTERKKRNAKSMEKERSNTEWEARKRGPLSYVRQHKTRNSANSTTQHESTMHARATAHKK